jgi:hypothetical protein
MLDKLGLLDRYYQSYHMKGDMIKMDLREIGFGDVDWIHLAQDRDRWRLL